MEFSIVTYNINFGGGSPNSKNVKWLCECDADFIVLQETTRKWEATLRPLLSDDYPHAIFKEGPGAGGMAIFSKFEITSEVWMEPTSREGWFHGWKICTQFKRDGSEEKGEPSSSHSLQILSVHLRPPINHSGWRSPRAYFQTSNQRLADMKHYYSELDETSPFLILGDYNESHNGAAVKWLLKEKGLVNVTDDPHVKKKYTIQWPLFWGILIEDQYDHIVYDPKTFDCSFVDVSHVEGSDHFPVLARFCGKNDDS